MNRREERARRDAVRADRWEQKWDLWWTRFLAAVPWVLLAASVVAILNRPGQTGDGPAVTVGLTLLAAAWVLLGSTLLRSGQPDRPALTVVYFVGLVAVSALLMAHDLLFLIFAVTPFFHALLLSMRWIFPGVALTSIAFNAFAIGVPGSGMGSGDDMTFVQNLLLYVGVVALQTVTIGGGMVAGEMTSRHWKERKQMVARLEAALEENAGLHAQLLTQVREAGVNDERQRMAREIHDTLAQGLTGIVTQLHAVQRSWRDPETAHTHVDRALSLARESLTEARRSVQALRPQQLEQSQLPEALAELTLSRGQETGIRPDLEVTGDPVSLSPAIEVALFRVAQEALTNVAKHANASRVGVTLSYLDDVVLLDVRDDGRGMPEEPPAGFGLTSMRQRVRGIGGSMAIESEPGAGTAVSLTVPLVPDAEPAYEEKT